MQQNIEFISDVICNKCNKSCISEGSDNFDYATLKVLWGYGSDSDGELHEAHLCEKCFNLIISDFKVPSLIEKDVL